MTSIAAEFGPGAPPARETPARWKRWTRITLSLLSGLLFGLVIGGAVVALLATQLFDFRVLTVETGSMRPTLNPGDLVVIRPHSIAEVKERDIVLYENEADHVQIVHRVIGIHRFVTNLHDAQTGEIVSSSTEVRLVTQGDANGFRDDQETTAQTYRGAVWFSVPRLGETTQVPLQTALFGVAGFIAVAWASWEAYRWLGRRQNRGKAA